MRGAGVCARVRTPLGAGARLARALRAGAVLRAGAALLAGGLTLRACAPGPRTDVRTESLAAVRQVLLDQQEAWNRGDLAAFMVGYWRSDSLTFYSAGSVQRGWQATYDRYVHRYQSGGEEMGHLDFEIHSVALLSADHALAKGAWFLKRSKDAPHWLFTLVLRRFPELGWKIVHDHTSSEP